MCGIAGYFGPPARDLATAIGTLQHRGPDVQRVEEGPGYGLGHSLLSIIGDVPIEQPIHSRDGRIVLAFNGEIYNYIEIREADPTIAEATSGRSDTEVLVEGFAERGGRIFDEANGMFAVAIYDGETQTGYLVRDRLGIKPLYYARIGPTLVFGSELRTVRELAGLEPEPDPEAYYSYVRFRYPIGERTFDRNVRMLPPGSVLTWSGGSVVTRRFWEIRPQPPFTGTYDEALDGVAELLEDSIRLRMRSDHSFCTFLSGGLDSSYLTAIAAETVAPLQTYSIAFDEAEFDESQFSERVSERLATDHYPYLLRGEEYAESLASFVEHLESPIGVPNQVALSVLSRELAKDHRCVLSGEGADEVFGGYGRIFLLPSDWELLRHVRSTGSDPAGIGEKLENRYGTSSFPDYPSLFIERYGYLDDAAAHELLEPFFNPAVIDTARLRIEHEIRELFNKFDHVDPFTRQLLVFQELHLPGLLLRLDTASMFYSVEARVPFLDHRLVEFANSLPIEYRMRRLDTFDAAVNSGSLSDELSEIHDVPKSLLKDVARSVLPDAIVDRRKLGFPVPPTYYSDHSKGASMTGEPYLEWVRANLGLCAKGGWLCER
jgi:asparagine synthase (glutamine-hydrolysing)